MRMRCGTARCEHAFLPAEIRHSAQSREHGDGSSGCNLSEENANKWGTGNIFIIWGLYQHRAGCYILTMKKGCAPCERTSPHLAMPGVNELQQSTESACSMLYSDCSRNDIFTMQDIICTMRSVTSNMNSVIYMYYAPAHITAWNVNKDPFGVPYQTRCGGLSQILYH